MYGEFDLLICILGVSLKAIFANDAGALEDRFQLIGAQIPANRLTGRQSRC
jgi:hypothetical protein